METAKIIVCSEETDEQKFDNLSLYLERPDAIRDGYKYFKDLLDNRADWLMSARVIRDFEDNLEALVILKIGPLPKWDQLPGSPRYIPPKH